MAVVSKAPEKMDLGENGAKNKPVTRNGSRRVLGDLHNQIPTAGVPAAKPKAAGAGTTQSLSRSNSFSSQQGGGAPVAPLPQPTARRVFESTGDLGATRGRAQPARGITPSARAATDIDARDANEPLAVTEYVGDLYIHLRSEELRTQLQDNYMERQPNINERMRGILVDWLVEVHLKFKLVPDTLYLTVLIIDKYLEQAEVSRADLQLVGVTALLLASKYEEIYPPEIRDLEYITDRAYTKQQILKMEGEILSTLGFNITVPTIYCFLLRYLKAAHAEKRIVQLSCYIAERMLQEQCMLKHLPSQIACCAIFIARKNFNRNPWSPTLEKYTNYAEADLLPGLQDIAKVLAAPNKDLSAVNKKFSSQKFGAVANMPISIL